MGSQGFVVALHVCPGHRKPMQQRSLVRAIAGRGLEGDLHALPESPRQVLLIESETLAEFQLSAGVVKENITTRQIELMTLPRFQRLRVGTVVLELTGPCAPCRRMDEISPGLQEQLRGRRGVLARVIEGGEIYINDPIVVV